MAHPYPPADAMDAYYSNALPWVGRVRDFQVPTPDGGWEFDWNWKAAYNHALYTVRPFLYFHFAAGTPARRGGRRGADGFAGRLHPVLHLRRALSKDDPPRRRDAGDGDLPAGVAAPRVHRRAPLRPHRHHQLLLVTTEETRLEDLLARKVATGDIGATANTIVVLGSERVGSRLARMLCVVKHRGSAMSDEIVEYRVTDRGFTLG